MRSGPTDRPRSGLLPAPRSLNPAEILGGAPRFAQLRHGPTQMALDRRRPDLEGTADCQPGVLKSSINVDNLRWKMIGVCLHQPPPRPKPARIADLACHAARTTWARRALEGARPSCRLSGLRRPAPVSPVFAGCHVPSDRLQRMGESGAAAASARLGRWLPQLWGVGSR